MAPNFRLDDLRVVWSAFGARALARRVVHVARDKTGVLARPLTPDDVTLPTLELAQPDGGIEAGDVVARAERVLGGEIFMYGWVWKDTSWPPRWHVNPFSGHEQALEHWTTLSDDDPDAGDVKDVWELSRLPFTAPFVRAHQLAGGERWAEAWWEAVDDWIAANPIGLGPNWMCGQESSLRAIALCTGVAAFANTAASTPERVAAVEQLLGLTASRVRSTLGYALSQRNNHAVSELAFLLGVRAPGEGRHLRLLREVLADQFYDDGSYSQQSITYQRLAVQTLLWLRMARPDLGARTASAVDAALDRSKAFLERVTDPVSGHAPNHGANDGAALLDTWEHAYRDLRPTLTALLGAGACGLLTRRTTTTASRGNGAPIDRGALDSTYVTIRGPRSVGLVRAGHGRHRIGHDDQMALDLWVDGRNVLRDPGTYRYSAPAPWRNALAGAEVHNTLLPEGRTTGRLGRFLLDPGPPARVLHHRRDPEIEVVVFERAWDEAITRRLVARRQDSWVVVDHVVGGPATGRWNADPGPIPATLWSPTAVEVSSPSEQDPTSGWVSDHYAQREALPAVTARLGDGQTSVLAVGEGSQDLADLLTEEREVSRWLPPPNLASLVRSDLAALPNR